MAWYNSAKDLGNTLGKHPLASNASKIFGGREDSGLLGTGQYRSNEYKVDDKAFQASPEAQRNRQSFANALGGVQGRQGPQMNTAQGNEWRAKQMGLAKNLEAQMRGEGQSVAQMQMQRGLNQSLAGANSLAASNRGVSPAMAMRMAQQSQANASQDTLNQSGMLRAQEQQAARAEYGQLANSARGQDLDTAQVNVQSALQQRQLNDQQDRFLREGVTTMDERNRQANIDRERMKSQNSLGYNQVNSGAYQNAAQNRAGAAGGFGSAIAGIMAMSDEKMKTGIQAIKFDSPADSSFKPAMALTATAPEDEKFEPTIEAADSKQKEDTQKYLKDMGSTPSKSQHESMGKGLGQLGAAIGMSMSDGKNKTGAKAADGKSFLDALQAYTYKYKDPSYGEGPQLGVMAQDMEKHPIGKSMVVDTPEGKMIDYGKAGGVMMANQAMLNERLNNIESAFAARKKRSA